MTPDPEVLEQQTALRQSDSNQMDSYAAVLWLPSPEYQSGWREYYVRRDVRPGRARTGRAYGGLGKQ